MNARGKGIALSVLIAAAVLCASCSNLFGTTAKTGSVSISLSSPSAKAVVAGSTDYTTANNTIAAYKVTISSASTGNSYTSATVFGGVCTITGIYAADSTNGIADYAVTVLAYNSATTQDSTTLIAQGSASGITVKAGESASASVALSFTQSAVAGAANAGGFSLPISWPASTGLPYVYAKLDDTTGASFFSATSATSPYSATIAKAGLSGGAHLLYLYFADSSTPTRVVGPFVESLNIWDGVTSTQWSDASGNTSGTRIFAATEFADTNASLSALSCATTDATPVALTMSPAAFDAATTAYSLSTGFTSTSFAFSATLVVGSQNIAATWNGTAKSWSSVNGSTYKFTLTSLDLISGVNTLSITVTAPDKTTTKTYTITVNCGTAGTSGVSVSVPSYQGLGFASSATIVQGSPFALETSNTTLDAITSGWTWYLDGTGQSETSQRYLLTPSVTSSMLGTYSLAGSVTYSGVTYSGRTTLTVNRSSLSPSGTITSTYTGFSGPVGMVIANNVLYMTEFGSDVVSAVDLSAGTPGRSIFAGNGTIASTDATVGTSASFNIPHGIATDGSYLYVVDTGSGALRKIDIATTEVTTLVTDTTRLKSSGMMTFDGSYLYVTHPDNHAIYKVNRETAEISSLVTGMTVKPYGIATDGSYLYVSTIDDSTKKIVRVPIAGGSYPDFAALSSLTYGLYACGDYLYASDYDTKAIRKILISSSSTITILTPGSLSDPRSVVTDGSSLYLADYATGCVYQIK